MSNSRCSPKYNNMHYDFMSLTMECISNEKFSAIKTVDTIEQANDEEMRYLNEFWNAQHLFL